MEQKIKLNLIALLFALNNDRLGVGASHWSRAVKDDAINLVNDLFSSDNVHNGIFEGNRSELLASLINHVGCINDKVCFIRDPKFRNYLHEAVYGGNFLIYDDDIAERYCTPSELKKVTRKDGSIRDHANSSENWLDVQERAIRQAIRLIIGNLGAATV